MAALPRGVCSSCLQEVALRVNGTPREHYVRPVESRLVLANVTSGHVCAGSGNPPLSIADAALETAASMLDVLARAILSTVHDVADGRVVSVGTPTLEGWHRMAVEARRRLALAEAALTGKAAS